MRSSYIPPNVIHAAVNDTLEPVIGLIARTPADETVTEYDIRPMAKGV